MKFYFNLLKHLLIGAFAYYVIVYGGCYFILTIANMMGVVY